MRHVVPLAQCLLLVLVPASFAQKRLPELRKITEVREILRQRNQLVLTEENSFIGWDDLVIKKAELAGERVFLLERKAELIDVMLGRIRSVGTTSLWTSDLELIVVQIVESTGKVKTRTLYRWVDGKLTKKQGKKSVVVMNTPGRPQALEELQIAAGKFKLGAKGKLLLLDYARSQVEEVEYEVQGKYDFKHAGKKFKLTKCHTSRQGGVDIYFGDDKKIYRYSGEELPVRRSVLSWTVQASRLALAGNPAMQKTAVQIAIAGWRRRSKTYKNANLDLNLTLPKDWRRVSKVHTNQVFVCQSRDLRAAASIAIEVVGQAYSNAEYAVAFKKAKGPHVEPKNKFKMTKAKAGNRKAVELQFGLEQKGRILVMRTLIVVESGIAFTVDLSVLAGHEKAHAKDFKRFLRSLRFKN